MNENLMIEQAEVIADLLIEIDDSRKRNPGHFRETEEEVQFGEESLGKVKEFNPAWEPWYRAHRKLVQKLRYNLGKYRAMKGVRP